jgi:hypothetical protein
MNSCSLATLRTFPPPLSWARRQRTGKREKGKTVCVCRSGEKLNVWSATVNWYCYVIGNDFLLHAESMHSVFLWSDTGENEIQLSAVVGAIPLAYILHFALHSLTAKSQIKIVWMQKMYDVFVACDGVREQAYVRCGAVCRLNTPSESHSFSMKIDFSSCFFSPFLRLPFSAFHKRTTNKTRHDREEQSRALVQESRQKPRETHREKLSLLSPILFVICFFVCFMFW